MSRESFETVCSGPATTTIRNQRRLTVGGGDGKFEIRNPKSEILKIELLRHDADPAADQILDPDPDLLLPSFDLDDQVV